MKPKNRWKPFSQKTINLLEKTYQSQQSGKQELGWIKLETLEVRGQHPTCTLAFRIESLY